ncbi:MAG: histidine phosphatase family protein [bacterium]
MGRRLVLMRHAKSDWSHDGLSDHERPLNGRGRRSAPAMAQALAARGFVPDVAASSDSQRTTETWILLAAELGLDVEPRWSRELYLAGPATILAAAARLPAAGTCGLILGHNPGMSEAATLLADLPLDLRTADAALFECADDAWPGAAARGAWRLVEVVRARDMAP